MPAPFPAFVRKSFVCLFLASPLLCGLQAQEPTAHFSGAIDTLGHGFSSPWGVAVDGSGNVFVADLGGEVYEIVALGGATSSTSTVHTLGSGFIEPIGVAVDGSGNVFVADVGNGGAVSEIIAGGSMVNTLASGVYTSAVAVDGSDNVFVADDGYQNFVVKEIVANGGMPSSSSMVNTIGNFSYPDGVAVDGSGNVFVADRSAGAVYEIVAGGPQVVLGTGFGGPHGVAVDRSGNVFVADTNNNAVKEIVAVGGVIPPNPTVITLRSGFNYPTGVAVDGHGNVFVADASSHPIQEIMLSSVNFGSVAIGTTTPIQTLTFTFDTEGYLSAALVLTQGASGLDFTDAGTGTCTTDLNTRSTAYRVGDTCTVDVLFTPRHPGERLGAVVLLGMDGTQIAAGNLQGVGTGPQIGFLPGVTKTLGMGFNQPYGVAVDSSGDVFVADTINGAVKEIVAVGGVTSSTSQVLTLGAGFSSPTGIAVDGSGNVFVGDDGSSEVKEIVAVGGITSSTSTVLTLGSGFSYPCGVAVDGSGDVFVADQGHSAVKEIVAVGGITSSSSTVLTLGSGFNQPAGVAVDGSGNVFVADTYNNAVKEIVAVGGVTSSISMVLPLGSGFSYPWGVAIDGSGNVFVAENFDNTVKEIVAVGGVTSSTSMVLDLGGGFRQPTGVAVDGRGNLFVADFTDSTVKEIDIADAPGLSFASTAVGATSSDSPQTVTVENTGNLALTFETPLTGSNPSISTGFSMGNGSTCPQLSTSSPTVTLASGASCTFPFGFTPTAVGSFCGGAMLEDDSLNAVGPVYTRQTIPLSGTATPGPATQLVVSAVASTVVSGGNLGTVTATIEDASGNTETTSTAAVTATIQGPNGYSQTVMAAAMNGLASLHLSALPLTTLGTYTVTTSSAGLTGTTSTVTVTDGAATKLVLVAVATSIMSGQNLGTLTVTVEDASGNTVTTSTAAVTTTIQGPNGYSQTVMATAMNGFASLHLGSLPLTTAGTYTVTTSSAGLTGTTSTVTVTVGAASKLVLGAVSASITSGQSLGTTTATVEDASGNTVTSPPVGVTATLTGPNNYSEAVTGMTVNGIVTLNLASLNPTAAGTYTLTVPASGLTPASSVITVVEAAQTIALPSLPNISYGAGATTLPSTTSAGLPITYTVTGPATLHASSLVITGAGTVTLTATQPGTSQYSPVTMTDTFTVAKAASTTTLSSSSGVALTGTSITLTTQIASVSGTPTGSVAFLNGSTVLGTTTVSSTGSAILTLSTLPTGALSLTADYGGDANFLASVSTLSVTDVQDFGIGATRGTPSVAVVPGAAASFTITLTPGASGFSGAILLTAVGMPAGATYSFSPATLTPDSALARTVLTVQTTRPAHNLGRAAGMIVALLLLPFGVSRKRREALGKAALPSALGLLLLLGGLAGLTGCGGNESIFGQSEQSYTLTVIGTSGTLIHSTTVVLNVQ